MCVQVHVCVCVGVHVCVCMCVQVHVCVCVFCYAVFIALSFDVGRVNLY